DNVLFRTRHGDHVLPISSRDLSVLYAYSSPVTYRCWLRNVDGFHYYSDSLKRPKKIKTEILIPIDGDYALTDTNVVARGEILPGSIASSFRRMGMFARDDRNVYAVSDSREGIQICDWPEMESVVPIGDTEFFADRLHLYRYNRHFIVQSNYSSDRKLRNQDRSIFGDEPTITSYLQELYPERSEERRVGKECSCK